jgi:Acyl-protein synthetase, LuxE
MTTDFASKIFGVGKQDFTRLALEVFQFQAAHNPLYKDYLKALGIRPDTVTRVQQIPFLPIGFYKTHLIQTTEFVPEVVFESSGTSGTETSRHAVKRLALYEVSFTRNFEAFYGPVQNLCILGLLPSYLERSGSSLVYMVDALIKGSQNSESGFYLYDHERLASQIETLERQAKKSVLIGVTFALLDFAKQYPMKLAHTVVMETGGMKGRRPEITRCEVHEELTRQFGLARIDSEYGMTELLSQAYSRGNGVFEPAPWMRVLVRDEDDPFDVRIQGEGILNIIDLANVYSCSFLATQDVGKLYPDGRFEVLGRLDNSDLRGCNLLVG